MATPSPEGTAEETPAPQPGETRAGAETARFTSPFGAAVWTALVAGFALFVVLGSVPAHAYRSVGASTVRTVRDRRVLDIWTRQAANLPDFGGEIVPRTVFLGAILFFLAGSAYALWLALSAEDRLAPVPRPAGEARGAAPEADPPERGEGDA